MKMGSNCNDGRRTNGKWYGTGHKGQKYSKHSGKGFNKCVGNLVGGIFKLFFGILFLSLNNNQTEMDSPVKKNKNKFNIGWEEHKIQQGIQHLSKEQLEPYKILYKLTE